MDLAGCCVLIKIINIIKLFHALPTGIFAAINHLDNSIFKEEIYINVDPCFSAFLVTTFLLFNISTLNLVYVRFRVFVIYDKIFSQIVCLYHIAVKEKSVA